MTPSTDRIYAAIPKALKQGKIWKIGQLVSLIAVSLWLNTENPEASTFLALNELIYSDLNAVLL